MAEYMYLFFLIFLRSITSFPTKSFAMLSAVENYTESEDLFKYEKVSTRSKTNMHKTYLISEKENWPAKDARK